MSNFELQVDGKIVRLTSARVVVGRGSTCDIRVENDAASREHVELVCHQGVWTVRDLGSKNGTFLAGRKIDRTETLPPGVQVQLGPGGTVLSLTAAREKTAPAVDLDAFTVVQPVEDVPRETSEPWRRQGPSRLPLAILASVALIAAVWGFMQLDRERPEGAGEDGATDRPIEQGRPIVGRARAARVWTVDALRVYVSVAPVERAADLPQSHPLGQDAQVIISRPDGREPRAWFAALLESATRPLLVEFHDEAVPISGRENLLAIGHDPSTCVPVTSFTDSGDAKFRCIVTMPDDYPAVLDSPRGPIAVRIEGGRLENTAPVALPAALDAGTAIFEPAARGELPEQVPAVVGRDSIQSVVCMTVGETELPLFMTNGGRSVVAGALVVRERPQSVSIDGDGLRLSLDEIPLNTSLPALGGSNGAWVIGDRK